MKKKRRHKKHVYVCYCCLFMRVRRGYDSSPFFFLLQLDEYKICSTGPVFLFSPSCSFYHLFDSTVFSLSLFSFQHLVPLSNKKKYYYYSSFITSLIPIFPNSRDATIIVCPIFFFAIFIFLEERSHLVFRLLYN
jgi:hypothetical protein